MSKLISLSLALLILILLFLLLPFRLLPQLPPQGSRGLCVTCHWDKQDIPAHADIDFTDESCLQCHNPHTHFGEPYLPSIDSCLICHYDYKAKPGYYVHEPVEKKQCTSCHQPHQLFEQSQLTVPLDKLCLSCHRDDMLKFEDPVGHMPYELNQCLSCHEAHMTREPDLLRQPLAKLCASCHRMEDEWNRPFQHMPFERDLCMDCHLPHASAWDGLIRQDQTRLCYSCHYDRPNELNRPITHGPYGEGQCTACHEPHSSVGDMLLPHEQEEEFCFMCHDRIKKIGWYDSPHSTVFEGEDKVCGACHEHHSSHEIFLSRFPLDGRGNLCLYCHDPIGKYYFDSAHSLLRCGECHEIHGAMYDALLLGPELEVCAQCHPGLEHRTSNHPVGEIYTDVLRNRALLCTSCHGPHGTEYTRMRILPANELCMACHTSIR
ncbi:cytochrome c3 family protein [Dethiobacter alkaliphilus]|uniref:cytochrome c3 family protein n=1 Tax=Dethiobacter alkaliphilus TaxID=427926 RepID=UPI002227F03D|nr:cytochrome c3 family protein [Dethiobacter alkaliphilus]MCW3491327.1 cytochrome c3 family protein [Dethiobacter alkaliphilus]